MSIIPIHFWKSQHKSIIMKLCRRNNFYVNDVYINLYKKLPIDDEILAAKILPKLEGNTLHGHFYSEVINAKTKVTGFVIYNTSHIVFTNGMTTPLIESELLFILVDKKYQKQTVGTELMQQFMDDVKSRNIIAVVVKSEPNLVEWYSTFGFKADPAYESRKLVRMMYCTTKYHQLTEMTQYLNSFFR